jgi:hypothetical protein
MLLSDVDRFPGEGAMLEPLVDWLKQRRRIRPDSYVLTELAWFGRYVDLVTLNRTATTVAFELKLQDNGRALEQAALNTLSFDRSYFVTATSPGPAILARASEVDVGVILVKSGEIRLVREAGRSRRDPLIRSRLLKAIKERGSCSLGSLTS